MSSAGVDGGCAETRTRRQRDAKGVQVLLRLRVFAVLWATATISEAATSDVRRSRHGGVSARSARSPFPGEGARVGLLATAMNCSRDGSASFSDRAKFFECATRMSASRARQITRTALRGDRMQPQPSTDDAQVGRREFPESRSGYRAPSSSKLDEYVAVLELGTPPRSFSFIVDTGSDLTWLQCEPCTQCYPQSDPIFDSDSSESYVQVACSSSECGGLPLSSCEHRTDNCVYLYSYGDGSSTYGYLANDTLSLRSADGGNEAQFRGFVFGCSTENQGTFDDYSADGLVGLGQGPLSLSSQLGARIRHKFSYCLVERLAADSVTSPLLFGDIAVPTGDDVVYTPIVKNEVYNTYYYVSLSGISVGGTKLRIPSSSFAMDARSGEGGMILDSGTTITQLEATAYAALEAAFKKLVSYPTTTSASGLSLCYNTTGIDEPVFPGLTLHFDGPAEVVLPVDNYFIAIDTDTTVCLIMMGTDDSLSILGNWQQQNFQILYDGEEKRIGFKQTSCVDL